MADAVSHDPPPATESQRPDVWYRDGLRFRCTRCGNCCTGEPGYVWVNREEVSRIAEFLDEPVDQVSRFYVRRVGRRSTLRCKANGDCVFYDRERGCTIYPVRPRQCRSWPFWSSNLKSPAHWERTCDECPGAGTGDFYTVDQIVQNLRLIRI